MAEVHLYTDDDRRDQLRSLKQALLDLMAQLAGAADPRSADYESSLAEVERLLAEGFTQDDLSTLSRAVPQLLLDPPPEGEPPLVEVGNNHWIVPESYWRDLRARPLEQAAEILRTMGHYLPEPVRKYQIPR